jgi:hypothetical protein
MFVEQLMHVAPPLPHAWSDCPGEQVLPVQQPVVHPTQFAATHRFALQAWLCVEQLMQLLPALPHATSSLPVTHASPEQQPVGHVAELQPASEVLLASSPPPFAASVGSGAPSGRRATPPSPVDASWGVLSTVAPFAHPTRTSKTASELRRNIGRTLWARRPGATANLRSPRE